MSTPKIIIGNDTPEQGITWASSLKKSGAFAVTRKPEGAIILNCVKDEAPDIIVIEAKMADMDAVELISKIKQLNSKLPLIVVVANYELPHIEEQVMQLGAKCFLVKPFDVKLLCAKISEIARNERGFIFEGDRSRGEANALDLECMVTDVIHKIGIPAHIKGYHYLRHAIMISIKDSEMINCITKMLYPAVADAFKTTPSRVERAIRHAIELAWDRGDIDILNGVFGYTIRNSKGKPTNSEFIALISDKLRLQLKTNNAYSSF